MLLGTQFWGEEVPPATMSSNHIGIIAAWSLKGAPFPSHHKTVLHSASLHAVPVAAVRPLVGKGFAIM